MNFLWIMWITPGFSDFLALNPVDKPVDSVDNENVFGYYCNRAGTAQNMAKYLGRVEGGQNMKPIILEIAGFTVYSYGFMIALGVLVLLAVGRRLAPSIGLERDEITDLGIAAVVGGLLGAYINFIISYEWAYYMENPIRLLRFWDGGLVFLGGLLGGIAAAVIFIRIKKLPLWEIADLAAILIPIGYGFGRLGCFLGGCCYGARTLLPWAVKFPGVLDPRHPTQLYSVLLAAALIAFALWFRKRRSFAGQAFLLFLGLYAIGRGIIEELRFEPKLLGSLSIAQTTGLGIILAVICLYPILARRNSYKNSQDDTRAS